MKTLALVWISLAVGVVLGWALRARMERSDPFEAYVLPEHADKREVEEFLESLGRRRAG
jgi:hypothetical protein